MHSEALGKGLRKEAVIPITEIRIVEFGSQFYIVNIVASFSSPFTIFVCVPQPRERSLRAPIGIGAQTRPGWGIEWIRLSVVQSANDG